MRLVTVLMCLLGGFGDFYTMKKRGEMPADYDKIVEYLRASGNYNKDAEHAYVRMVRGGQDRTRSKDLDPSSDQGHIFKSITNVNMK